ncbi:FAD-dependent pyridine nucleotide-disulfide oxidoreductase [Anopheles sinensis]|uniref:FAD-dependent pyridine nucleotide-disulfide oxidoreductase n=1 Tax=Anopheles sinensis TaxID=74873 RepID=A0A084VCQ0_ANOSI|nr:FAD-dependent pyridine nucleotide-disulfide oxidoreductase [Anopheles sinensis]
MASGSGAGRGSVSCPFSVRMWSCDSHFFYRCSPSPSGKEEEIEQYRAEEKLVVGGVANVEKENKKKESVDMRPTES